MIVVDSSALIEIVIDAPKAEACIDTLAGADEVLISAGTKVECLIVAFGRKAEAPMRALFEEFGLRVEPVTGARARAAADAYKRYGKRWHAAALNFGDCFAYALAREFDCPLLYVGGDFAKTDVISAVG